MRLAVLDLGTNSVRLDIYEVQGRSTLELLQREKVMVRLGQDVFATGRLQDAAMQRTLRALKKFRELLQRHQVSTEYAVATSAMREAENGAEFLQHVQQSTGFAVQIISGQEEARLILKGILQDPQAQQGSFCFIDIGGGSTEIGVVDEDGGTFLESVPLGAARLNQLFLRSGSNHQAVQDMRVHIQEVLATAKGNATWGRLKRCLGSSGSVRAIQNILEEMGRGKQIRLLHLSELNERMSVLSSEELLDIPGMNPNRVDIIVSGSVVLEETMRFFSVPVVEYTDFALRDGMLIECIESLSSFA